MECSDEPASAPRGRKIRSTWSLMRCAHGIQATRAKYLEVSLKLHAQTNVLDNLGGRRDVPGISSALPWARKPSTWRTSSP